MAEVAALCNACPIDEMVRQISGALPGAEVKAIQQVVKGRMETLHRFGAVSIGMSVVVILVGSLVVLTTMMSSVRERREEIGIFRAMGFRKRHVMEIIFTEAAFISVPAGMVGYLAGIGASFLALRFFSQMERATLILDPLLFVGATLLSVLGAMNTPTTGQLTVDSIDLYRLTSEQRADFRREFLGFVFQSFHLIPYLTLLENVMLPLTTIRMAGPEKRARALAALERVGLGGKADRLPGEASGGEMERCAIARAIVNAPPVLLADEPTGNLDTRTADAVMALFKDLNAEGITIVMVTHSPRCAGHVDRVLAMADGRLVAVDSP